TLFFRGCAETTRAIIQVVKRLSPDSVIALASNARIWSEGALVYADNMSRSKFCFCPRGDTASSRRIFDAISAGCIPILTVEEAHVLPFQRTGLNYSEFAVVAEKGSFSTAKRVETVVKDLSSRSAEQLSMLREGLVRGQSLIVYGLSKGPTLADMEPFHGTASMFLLEVQKIVGDAGLWKCPSSGLGEDMLSPRTLTNFPPEGKKRRQWLRESETIVNVEHSLLFCAPPNTGSLQFRMLAKRMKGVDHWTVSDDQSLLFDKVASELPLLDLDNTQLMEDIFKDNGSGWIKIGVIRDPVTRLLSAYLDLVRNWSSESEYVHPDQQQQQPHRGLRSGDGWEWFDALRRYRDMKEGDAEQKLPETGNPLRARTWGGYDEGGGSTTSWDKPRSLQHTTVPSVPTFEELLDLLADNIWAAPSAFRPAASLCGMSHSPFDTIIPFETLQRTSTKVLKSLPGDIWRSFGDSGWGPDGKHAFMEFDYGTAVRHVAYADQDNAGDISDRIVQWEQNGWHGGNTSTSAPPNVSPRARDLFSAGSCAWTEYYANQTMLNKVGHLYSADYGLFGWYDIKSWHERMEACFN
ncbi:unnamed protein product, partial [Laminaria digitata]